MLDTHSEGDTVVPTCDNLPQRARQLGWAWSDNHRSSPLRVVQGSDKDFLSSASHFTDYLTRYMYTD